MSIVDEIKPISQLKARAPEILKQINETHRPVIITQNGEPRAVLIDPKSYENMRNALGILKLLSHAEEDISKGRLRPQDEVFDSIEQRLEKQIKSK